MVLGLVVIQTRQASLDDELHIAGNVTILDQYRDRDTRNGAVAGHTVMWAVDALRRVGACAATWPLSASSVAKTVTEPSSRAHSAAKKQHHNATWRSATCISCGVSLGEPGIGRSSRAGV